MDLFFFLSTIVDHHSPQKIIILLHIRKIRPPIIEEEEEEEASNEMVKYKIVEASKCYYSGRKQIPFFPLSSIIIHHRK